MAGDAAETQGWLPKFGLAAAISLNLGIINLLPFPILDGGMILLLIIESVIRRDIEVNIKERIYQAAFVVIIVFFAFVIFNDVTKLPILHPPQAVKQRTVFEQGPVIRAQCVKGTGGP